MEENERKEASQSCRSCEIPRRQHVRITKEKMKFATGGEQNFSTEIFRIAKITERMPRPVFELEDLNRTPIDGQFYQEELTPVRVTKRKSTR